MQVPKEFTCSNCDCRFLRSSEDIDITDRTDRVNRTIEYFFKTHCPKCQLTVLKRETVQLPPMIQRVKLMRAAYRRLDTKRNGVFCSIIQASIISKKEAAEA